MITTTVLHRAADTRHDTLIPLLTMGTMLERELEESLQLDLQLAAGCDVPVLLSGAARHAESLALSIHRRSTRREMPFVVVDARQRDLPPAALELLRREAGPGAPADGGPTAPGGTLFIANIEAMSPAMQGALLHFLERPERRVRRGLRVITASTASLHEQAQMGRFRADLYYRLNLIHIALQPRAAHAALAGLSSEESVATAHAVAACAR